ncbi:MAG: orotate phosphoribosyltransferase [Oscillospiraceae bacterium]|jgi:orotate phosphoribosyltransferase|nr:orotate phosphoribosyltransferase [Oscillospiraceae bacterium]
MSDSLARRIATDLLSIQAVFLRPDQPFTWASGIQSPIYCDNRLTLSAPEVRRHVEEGFAEVIRARYPDCEGLMGTSTAGIGHAAITAFLMDLPMGYVRGSAKTHGRTNRIEGKYAAGQKVVVVEDLISTAGSAIETAEVLREAGLNVLGIVSIVTYGMQKGIDRLAAARLTNYSLCDFDTLAAVAAEQGYIPQSAVAALKRFRDAPNDGGWKNML